MLEILFREDNIQVWEYALYTKEMAGVTNLGRNLVCQTIKIQLSIESIEHVE